jgi:hypothetical protein
MAELTHILAVDYFPFTYCSAVLAMLLLKDRFMADLDDLCPFG